MANLIPLKAEVSEKKSIPELSVESRILFERLIKLHIDEFIWELYT